MSAESVRVFTLQVLTPEKVVFEGETDAVSVPGLTGEIGILAHHADMTAVLKQGRVRVGSGDSPRQVAISDGYVRVTGGRVEIMAETAQMWIA